MSGIKTINNEELFTDVVRIIDGGGAVDMRVKGFSMRPFLRNERDTVHLAAIDVAALRKGMVVLFRYRNRHILHRIRRIDGNRLLIKGDGNYRSAELVTRGDIAAYAESIGRNGKAIGYDTLKWHILSIYSLTIKCVRTAYIDAVRLVKRLFGIKDQ